MVANSCRRQCTPRHQQPRRQQLRTCRHRASDLWLRLSRRIRPETIPFRKQGSAAAAVFHSVVTAAATAASVAATAAAPPAATAQAATARGAGAEIRRSLHLSFHANGFFGVLKKERTLLTQIKRKGEAEMAAVNAGYAEAQMARLSGEAPKDKRQSTDQASDAATKRGERAAKWNAVLQHIAANPDAIGSRTPTDAPAWVTLEVLTGGFASGGFLAALRPGDSNGAWLTDGGLRRLWALLDSGCYRVDVPEHGVLLALAWLNRAGHADAANRLAETIAPWLGALQFFPVEAASALEPSPRVSVATLGEAVRALQGLAELAGNPRVERIRVLLAQREAVLTWLPIKWEALALMCETIACGHPPSLERNADGKLCVARSAACASEACGWPCQSFPDGWADRARALLARCDAALAAQNERARAWSAKFGAAAEPFRNAFKLNNEHTRPGSSFQVLLHCLRACAAGNSRGLTGRDVSRLREVIAGSNTKHGLPGSDAFAAYRRNVEASIGVITGEIAKELVERLQQRSGAGAAERGIEEPATFLAPVQLPNGTTIPVPEPLAARIRRAKLGTVQELLDQGLVPSGEVLATLVPALVAAAQTSFIAPNDLALRRLFYAITVAFSRRRSLLLLDLQHQVTIHELPWVEALEHHCQAASGAATTKTAMRGVLEDVVVGTLRSFPQTIIPNKLLQSITELIKQADAQIPVVEEVAADIFMGRFTKKYLSAARVAADVLSNTFYSHYYGLDADWRRLQAEGFDDDAFAQMCRARAGQGKEDESRRRWSVADNGKIIEQEQLLTTHNLATLVHGLQIAHRLDFEGLCAKCFRWIIQSVASIPQGRENWRPRLQAFKDIAFAWRQLAYFFSMAPRKDAVVAELSAQLQRAKQTPYSANVHRLLAALSTPLEALDPRDAMLGWDSTAPFLARNVH